MENPDPPKGGDHGKPTINKGKRKTMKTALPNVVIVPPYDPYATDSSSSEYQPHGHFLRRQEELRRQPNAAAEEERRREDNAAHDDTDSERTDSESDPEAGDAETDSERTDSIDILNSQAPSAQSVNQIIGEPSVNQNENIHDAEEGEVQQQVQPKPNDEAQQQVQPKPHEGSYQGSNDVPVIKK